MDDFYAARSRTIPPLAWPNIAPPFSFVSGAIGIKLHDREDHAAYLSGWLQALRNDKRCIFTAATQAQAAADWLLGHMGAEELACAA